MASSPAARQRRARQRRKDGVAVFRLPLPEHLVLEALIASGMPEEAALRRAQVERELAGVVREWALRWTSSAGQIARG
jgi:hypothetical protein